MATLAAPQESSRAKEILQDLRRKRELLISTNPSLQKLQAKNHDEKKKTSQQNIKPPPVPRKAKKNRGKGSSSKNKKERGAQEILGDMRKERDSLTAVLESYKTPGSPSRRSTRSTGVSTAPTAASTRSWISSVGDDDSFCYSETSLEDSPKESSIEFIIDTEESDLYSISTKEEVQQAIDQIYKEVVPKALYAYQKETRTTTFTPDHASSWVFRSQSSARDMYREESVKISVSEKKTEKRRRRVKISEQRDSVYERTSSTRSDISFASSTASSIDLRRVRQQRSLLEDLVESVSELKETPPTTPVKRKKKKRSSRRPRQDDCSEGSAPILTKTSSSSGSLAPIGESSNKMDFDLSLFEKKGRKKKRNSSSSVASHYVLETKRRGTKTKKVVVKPTEPYVAPTPDPDNMLSWDGGSRDGSLLVSPVASVDQQLLVSPEVLKDANREEAAMDVSIAKREPATASKSEDLQIEEAVPVPQTEEGKREATTTTNSREERRREIPQEITTPSLDLQSEVSELLVFQDSKSKSTADFSPIVSRQLNAALARASEFNPVVIPLSVQEPTPEEPRAEYIPQTYMKTEFTMEDIVREMNIISEKIGKNGLQIPPGTVLTLRRNSSEPVDLDAESASGWTFSEPSDVSSCSYTLPSRRASRPSPDAGSDETPEQLAQKKSVADEDITERFCGGLYHMAVLSGMQLVESEI